MILASPAPRRGKLPRQGTRQEEIAVIDLTENERGVITQLPRTAVDVAFAPFTRSDETA
ncbi:hypothetical protein ACIO3O_08370 [Streptomyces sp. NPDC087440]|uniref:hypothetical protein n=1 Tax=Streptomyces sp. NPDC087440 TaxID=3365790 RepID=UPI00381C37F4